MPLFKKPIEQEFFNLRLRAGRPMTELEFYAKELTDWETSPERREMIDGDRYYLKDDPALGIIPGTMTFSNASARLSALTAS